MMLTRRHILSTGAAMLAAPSLSAISPDAARFLSDDRLGLPYLERIGQDAAIAGGRPYLRPSAIPPSYSHAIYVNCATSGLGAQKMWVIERAGPIWSLALWDEGFWARRDEQPCYSWPVSTGRYYPGERFAGPTPLGVFNVDERPSRHVRGWGSPGMYNSIYIDLHYSSGRISGVAIHGTTSARYRLLGRPDSHGCVRVTQANANQLWSFFHPYGRPGPESPLWREDVPRFFESQPQQSRAPRWHYNREGRLLTDDEGTVLTKAGYSVLLVFYRDD